MKHTWTTDESGNLVSGRELFEFIGMKGDMMLLKSLNVDAANSEDTMATVILNYNKKMGYNPPVGNITQLHYKYADRFEVV